MNRTLNEPARSMRIYCGLPKKFWVYAVSTVSYLFNRGPSVPMGFKIPEEVWTGKELKYSHLRTFGCTAYAHVDPEKRDKLDAKAIKCYFIGYGSDMFWYRFWDDRNKKILRHCDVTFDENILYKDREQKIQETTKQVGVELELLKSTPKDSTVETQQTPETFVEEPEVEQVTPKKVWMRSSWTIRAPDSIVTLENLYLEQMDVKIVFLHGELDKEIYMQQPEKFVVPSKEHMVCNLNRSLYGLKQAPIQWYKKFDSFISKSGFRSSMKEINSLKASLSSEFEMKDLGAVKQIFGMRISWDRSAGTLNLSQEQYVEKEHSPKTAQEREHMALVPYSLAVGSLMYAMTCTRPDIAHAVGFVSRYITNPRKEHWEAVKWLLRYLRGGTVVRWMSRLYKCVAQSTEAEFVAIVEVGKEMIWLEELGKKQLENILYTNSQSAIQLVKNPVYHSKMEHIRRLYHFTRRAVEEGDMCLEKIEGAKNSADMLKKYVDVAAPSNDTDQEALLAFQSLITSPNHFLANNWTKNTSFCSWFGVTCSSKRPRVVALALPNLRLQGTISPSLANLSFLRELNLENNFFHGDIPYGLGHLPHLRVIDVQNNQLKGNIPTSLFQHWRVQVISLAFNKLSGEMWQGPWYVPELRILNLRNNSLKGIIPPSIGNATKLLNFSLFGNRVGGNIPKEIGNLSQLAFLNLAVNQLTGFIPSSLFNVSSLLAIALGLNNLSGPLVLDEGNIVSNLESLSISRNQISGHIPSNICQLTELKILSISFNDITGEIPKNIDCLSKLKEFSIGYNPTDGTIPSSLGNISTLQYVYCVSNRLEGPIPPELGKLSNLIQLDFEENYIKGQIPKAIFNISSLKLIALTLNKLSGRIPTSTGLHLPNLEELHLTGNELEGEIPAHITNVTKLKYLGLADNFFSGSIPTNWGNLRDLRLLFLHINQLTSEHELPFFHSLADCNVSGLTTLVFQRNNLMGNIPPAIGKLKQLQGLYLNKNKLNGHIPDVICHLSNLDQLNLDDNELFGSIPACIGNLSMLQHLYLGSNRFSSKFPLSLWKMRSLLFLSMSRNSLEGEVPTDIGGLKAIVELDLSSNHFSGMLPITLGDLQNLKILNLSNNSFSGPIPLSFASLISLEILDLSVNALSGTIPRSLEELLYLKAINVSFNDLEGEIPNGGVFANSTMQSFLGNKDLCGMHKLEVPSCPITNSGEQSKSKELVLKIVIPVLTSSSLIFFLVSIWIMKQKKKGKSKNVEKFWEIKTHQLISYHEIQRATNYFDGSNLLGVGSSGSVYKGTLSGGTVVAIKVLNLENEEVCNRFDAECAVMRNVRHRNLVTVITTCSSDYIRAFVLQFMPNGSLESWLYEEESHLNLFQRVAIMLDVAVAIEYLHHGHNTPIVHCDLKPANILLDEDMVAHVGDFGISKILAVSKSMAHTETLGTLGYIAPEYGSEGIVSTSGDVYSYGIMLMEVLTKRRPTDEEICNENLDLRKWITQSFPGSMMDVVDDNLFPEEEQITSKSEICIASVIQLALECTMKTPESRINMKDVELPYKFDIPRAIWNPPLTRQGIPQPKCVVRVGVSESDTPQGTRPAYNNIRRSANDGFGL
ncbi:hypothetical protein BC332_12443 [Capsicum chinense]|nr:hypothetical protein BC332_12443 [Capsicum chinense]